MRPIRLEMQAFGPYAGNEVVDFRRLGERRFFLIHGPTGSGKTSVLDAICYALYGKSSGAERDVREMRSHHSSDNLSTQVVLDFSAGRESYRVWRRPEQEVPGRRTPIRADATLWQRTGIDDDSADGSVVATGLTKVTARIEGTLGFEADQFRQVVLLPQGQFRQALTADSAKRQEILEILFGTEAYRHIEIVLKDKADRLAKSLGSLDDRQKTLLRAAGAESLEELQSTFEAQRERLGEARKAENDASKAADAAAETLVRVKQDARRLEEARVAAQIVADMQSKAPEVDAMEHRRDRARRAAGCAGAEALLNQACAEEAARLDAAEQAKRDLAEAEAMACAASAALAAENSPERAGQRRQVETELLKLDSFAPKVEQIDQAREAVIEAGRAAAKAGDLAADAAARKSEAANGLAGARAERDEARAHAAETARWELQMSEAGAALKRAQVRAQLEEELQRTICAAQEANELADAAAARLERARGRATALRDAWSAGQAAALAAALEPGAPCPVCGSTSHPSPAHAASVGALKQAPSHKDLRNADAAAVAAETEWLRLRNASSEASQRVASVQGQLAGVGVDDDGGAATIAIPTLARIAQLQSELGAAERSLKEAKAAGRRAQALDEHIAQLERQLAADEAELGKAETASLEAASQLTAAKARLEEKELDVPAYLRSPDALKAAQAAAIYVRDELARALEVAEGAFSDAGRAVSGAQARAGAAAEGLEGAIRAVQARQTEFDAKVVEAGFESVDDYQDSKMSDDAADSLQRRIEQFQRELHAAAERLARAEGEAAGIREPDLSAAEAECAALGLAAKQALENRVGLENLMAQTRRQLDDLDKLAHEMREIEAEHTVIARVSDVANGRGHRNKLGMTFERFVLASMLDQVTEAATQRLQVMSRGRYALRRTMERQTSRSAAGLGLEVFDTYTGRERNVTTLSGGEGFMASLSLALGLADVVQSYAGGIRLDTIFVDEGFGTLDPESLDLAIDTLVELQRDGGRLVGVISHVPELGERIDARLEIRMTDRGSTSRFVVG